MCHLVDLLSSYIEAKRTRYPMNFHAADLEKRLLRSLQADLMATDALHMLYVHSSLADWDMLILRAEQNSARAGREELTPGSAFSIIERPEESSIGHRCRLCGPGSKVNLRCILAKFHLKFQPPTCDGSTGIDASFRAGSEQLALPVREPHVEAAIFIAGPSSSESIELRPSKGSVDAPKLDEPRPPSSSLSVARLKRSFDDHKADDGSSSTSQPHNAAVSPAADSSAAVVSSIYTSSSVVECDNELDESMSAVETSSQPKRKKKRVNPPAAPFPSDLFPLRPTVAAATLGVDDTFSSSPSGPPGSVEMLQSSSLLAVDRSRPGSPPIHPFAEEAQILISYIRIFVDTSSSMDHSLGGSFSSTPTLDVADIARMNAKQCVKMVHSAMEREKGNKQAYAFSKRMTLLQQGGAFWRIKALFNEQKTKYEAEGSVQKEMKRNNVNVSQTKIDMCISLYELWCLWPDIRFLKDGIWKLLDASKQRRALREAIDIWRLWNGLSGEVRSAFRIECNGNEETKLVHNGSDQSWPIFTSHGESFHPQPAAEAAQQLQSTAPASPDPVAPEIGLPSSEANSMHLLDMHSPPLSPQPLSELPSPLPSISTSLIQGYSSALGYDSPSAFSDTVDPCLVLTPVENDRMYISGDGDGAISDLH